MTASRPSPLHRAAALALLLAAAACAASDPVRPAGDTGDVLVAEGPGSFPTDPANLVRAEVRGDRLLVEVTFGGGCREHAFALYRDDSFLESAPVQLRLHLSHDGNGDPCRALLSRELEFDLAGVREAFAEAYGPHGTVLLRLHAPGAQHSFEPLLRYEF